MNKTKIIKTLIDTEKQYGLVETLRRVVGKNIMVSMGFSACACNADIDELALSVRSYNALRRANIITIGELIEQLNEGELKNLRNLGVKSISEIKTKLLYLAYNELNDKEKQAFWNEFIELNSKCRIA